MSKSWLFLDGAWFLVDYWLLDCFSYSMGEVDLVSGVYVWSGFLINISLL